MGMAKHIRILGFLVDAMTFGDSAVTLTANEGKGGSQSVRFELHVI